jgi:hypothetical protein
VINVAITRFALEGLSGGKFAALSHRHKGGKSVRDQINTEKQVNMTRKNSLVVSHLIILLTQYLKFWTLL